MSSAVLAASHARRRTSGAAASHSRALGAVAAEPTHGLKCETIHASSPLDSLIFGSEPWYEQPLAEQLAITRELVPRALEHHLQQSSPYAAYFARHAAPGSTLRLEQVPLISTRAFKLADVLSVEASEIEQWYVSSGTQGLRSRVGRDRLTLERLIGTVRSSLGLINEWHEDELTIMNLGPGREDTGNVWFQYVMSLIELLYPTHSLERGGTLSLAHAADLLLQLLARPGHVGIVGPPFLVLALCEHLQSCAIGVQGGERVTVLTAGGWKRYTGQSLARREFEHVVSEALGLSSRQQVRDAFNQVELNTVFLECSAHQKHVPPWVFASARDPRSLAPVPAGQTGLLAYLDASSNSYPAFIIGDDVGAVHVGACACGREGTRVEVVRRLDTRAQRGCARAMDRQHESTE